MRVGVDVDGVLYDYAMSVRRYLHGIGFPRAQLAPEPNRWEFYEDWGLTVDEFIVHAAQGVDAGTILIVGDPYPGSSEAMRRIRDAGNTIHIITDRRAGSPGKPESATRRWLDHHELPFDSLTFAADKTIVRTDMMIEDKLANYYALIEAGCDAYLYDRPWNQTLDRKCKRVANLAEFADRVIDASVVNV